MKKILSLILSAVLLCATMLTLASCGSGFEGTYEGTFITDESDVLTVTFGEDNAVELSLSEFDCELLLSPSAQADIDITKQNAKSIDIIFFIFLIIFFSFYQLFKNCNSEKYTEVLMGIFTTIPI